MQWSAVPTRPFPLKKRMNALTVSAPGLKATEGLVCNASKGTRFFVSNADVIRYFLPWIFGQEARGFVQVLHPHSASRQ